MASTSHLLILIAGLLIFLGLHSIRIVADGWRSARIAALGEKPWKGLYTLGSLIGFGLIIWGFSLARQEPVVLYSPPLWTRHLAALLVLVAFWLITAAYVPRNHFKAALGHPMVVGVKLWAFAHLLANGTLADVLLFGGFLVWAIVLFRNARIRDRAAGVKPVSPQLGASILTVVIGTLAWAAFAFWLHQTLFQVRPFG